MNNSSTLKNVALVVLTLFSIFALLRFTGIITSPMVRNESEEIGDSLPPNQKDDSSQSISIFTPLCDTCQNRYQSPEDNGGAMISLLQFNSAVSFYRNTMNKIDVRTCYVFLSKRAIDNMLNYNCNANGINCYFALTPATPTVPNKLTLLFTPAKSNRTAFTPNAQYIVFESNTLCPDVCGTNDTTAFSCQ